MTNKEDESLVTRDTFSQNEAVETVLSRFDAEEIIIPQYQRDADQWDKNKKSLFIESILNRLTVPAFYFARGEEDTNISEVVDGQQRLTTLAAFFKNEFTLPESDNCPYYGSSSHYAGKTYSTLDAKWQKVFRRYNLILVTMSEVVDLSIRLEIFRRINEGGTPLTGQDIRLSYYSQSQCVRFIQVVGIYDPSRSGSERMIKALDYPWPWEASSNQAEEWEDWWKDTKSAVGQTASEMFLWYLVGEYRGKLDALLKDDHALANLKIRFRGNTNEVLNIVCAQFKEEDSNQHKGMVRLLPDLEDLKKEAFPQFAEWWYAIRLECGPSASVAKHRTFALLIPSLQRVFGNAKLSDSQSGFVGKFLKSARETAREDLRVEYPEPKGKWTSQRAQLEAFDKVAKEIQKR